MPRISIIIPTYNAEKYIHECLESIYNQNLKEQDFEVIVMNDGSTDRSIEIIDDFVQKYRNIKILHQKNQGVSIARNNGLKAANGTYVWFVDADDLLVSNCLPSLLEVAEKNALDILKFNHLWLVNSEIKNPNSSNNCNCFLIPISGQEGFLKEFNPAQGYVCQYIYRKEFLLIHHLKCKENISFCEDTLFSISTLLKAERFMSVPLEAYLYRQHETSTIHTLKIKSMLSLNMVIEQTFLLSHTDNLNIEIRKKLKLCVFHLLTLCLWETAYTPSLYPNRKIIINDLKKRVPRFFLKDSFSKWKFSIFYSFFPKNYIWLRHHLLNSNRKLL